MQPLAALALIVLCVRALIAWLSPHLLSQSRTHAIAMGIITVAFVLHRVEVGHYSLLTWIELWDWTITDGQFLSNPEGMTRALRCYLLPLSVLACGLWIGASREPKSVGPEQVAEWIDDERGSSDA